MKAALRRRSPAVRGARRSQAAGRRPGPPSSWEAGRCSRKRVPTETPPPTATQANTQASDVITLHLPCTVNISEL